MGDFFGNSKAIRNEKVYNYFSSSVQARYIRFQPLVFNSIVALRADALVRAQNVTAIAHQQRPALQVSGVGWAGRQFSSVYKTG
jgi:hypothetical protein